MITIKCNGLKELYFRAYYDSPLSDDDVNEMEAAVAEIVADLPFEKDHGAECIYDTRPKNELEHYKWIVYSRKE